MTAIEELWAANQRDEGEQRVNGSLLEQATYICVMCGIQMKAHTKTCPSCNHCEDCDA